MLSSSTTTAGQLIIMRHAETNYNWPRKRLQGMSCSDRIFVSEKGKQEVISKLSSIKLPDTFICSPLLRCKQTAEIWAGVKFEDIKCKKILIDELKEIDVGELEHFYVDEIEKHDKYQKIWNLWRKNPLNFPGFTNGETLQHFQIRVLTAFATLCKYYINNPNDDICVITHGGPMRILKCFIANNDLSHMWDAEVENIERIELTPTQVMQLINYDNEVKTMFRAPSDKQLENESKESDKKLCFYDKPYKPDHWALHAPNMKDKNFVATLKIHGVLMGLKLNSTDARGYRGIVGLVTENDSQMSTTFNRDYSIEEKLSLSIALTIFAKAYEQFGIIAQTSIAGNNSQSVNPDGSVQIGNEKEPSLLHGHIIGRGNPDICYIANVPLRGPKAGAEMNLRGDGKDEGNTTKVKWKDEEMEIVAKNLGDGIAKILSSTPSLENVEVIAIRQSEPKKLARQSSDRKWITRALAAGIGALFAYRFASADNSQGAVSASVGRLSVHEPSP